MSPGLRRGGRSPYQRLVARAVFAISLLAFLIIGIVLVGDFSVQWWVLLLPFAVMVGPALAVRREGGRGPRGGRETDPWGQ